ncbi:Acetamidase regulatory [Hyphodiscus hymeniophilus]|uniref:Acetamidase regulatory n=1 Tax=Hyphodiscus hymeniophilus TaxID=353542 RepID=A0A9P6VM79_9HELO|nr:Acetamidase regulatory [Hyphodiscus hymeniophilus]
MAACDICHRRKVKCDSEGPHPCSRCSGTSLQCTFKLADAHKVRRRRKRASITSHSSQDSFQPVQIAPNVASMKPHLTASSKAPPLHNLVHSGSQTPQTFVPTMEDIVEEELSRTALTQFYQRGITGDLPWFPYKDGHDIRIAFIGTSASNLAQLVQGELNAHNNHDASLHFPFPSIRPPMPWKPHKEQPLVKWYSKVAENAGALPTKEVRDDLVNSFFEKIHPGFAIVDEIEFRTRYADPENPPPLLLLQSVLLAGAHVSQHPKIAESRSLVKMALFRRAKALFDMHFENDRMNLVQSALLFTWHFEGPDDVSSNAYYWVGIACRVAFGLGMHRDLGPSSSTRMPLGDTRIYRRIWWTLVQVDILASLHHGRPPMIDPDDFDQTPLNADDFIEYCGHRNQNININYCIQNSSLCTIIISVLKLSSPGSLRRCRLSPNLLETQKAPLDSRLVGWYLRLPSSLLDASSKRSDFWALQIQLHYNLTLLHLHRITIDTNHSSNNNHSSLDQQKSLSTRHTAALSIARLFDDIITMEAIERCSFTSLTALLSAAIQMSYEARSASSNGEVVLAIQSQNRLENMLPAMTAIAAYWPSAEAIDSIFRKLSIEVKEQMKSHFSRLESMRDDYAASATPEVTSTIDQVTELASWDPNFNGSLAAGWSNIFGVGDANPFENFEPLGLMDSWLTMPTAENSRNVG